MVRKTIGAIEHPNGFDHRHNTDETGVLLGQCRSISSVAFGDWTGSSCAR
jgi:hypothetical protein